MKLSGLHSCGWLTNVFPWSPWPKHRKGSGLTLNNLALSYSLWLELFSWEEDPSESPAKHIHPSQVHEDIRADHLPSSQFRKQPITAVWETGTKYVSLTRRLKGRTLPYCSMKWFIDYVYKHLKVWPSFKDEWWNAHHRAAIHTVSSHMCICNEECGTHRALPTPAIAVSPAWPSTSSTCLSFPEGLLWPPEAALGEWTAPGTEWPSISQWYIGKC